MEMPSFSHLGLCNSCDKEQHSLPHHWRFKTQSDKNLPGEGNASPALGQKGSLDDLENVPQAVSAAAMHVQHFPLQCWLSSSVCLLADEITVTTVTTVPFFSSNCKYAQLTRLKACCCQALQSSPQPDSNTKIWSLCGHWWHPQYRATELSIALTRALGGEKKERMPPQISSLQISNLQVLKMAN